MILCDSDIVIEYLKGNINFKEKFEINKGKIVLSAITLMELYYGALNKKELNKIKKALSNFEIIFLNEKITFISLQVIEIYSKSHGLKIPDALIAATAIYSNLSLWTNNLKDFKFIKGLTLLDKN